MHVPDEGWINGGSNRYAYLSRGDGSLMALENVRRSVGSSRTQMSETVVNDGGDAEAEIGNSREALL